MDSKRDHKCTIAVVMLSVLIGAIPRLCFAEQRFASAEDASRALFAAVRDGNDGALARILGAGKELLSGKNGNDTAERARFVAKYQQTHRLVRAPDETTVLYVGAENWAFPVPLVSRQGTWSFDAATGMREVLYRRIGENEINARAVCHVLAEAKRLDPRVANPDGEPARYHGYYFRILAVSDAADTGDDGGFVVIAHPVKYRQTGVRTFLVTDHDVVLERDLGPNTAALVMEMSTYDPNASWRRGE